MRRILFIVTFVLSVVLVQAQSLTFTSSVPTYMEVCGEADTFHVSMNNISGSTLTNITMILSMPLGMEYVVGSASGSGVTESIVTDQDTIVLSLPDLAAAATHSFYILARANCDLIGTVQAGDTLRNNLQVFHNSGNDFHITSPFQAYWASLSITNVSPNPLTGIVGSVLNRTITVTNGGLGNTSDFVVYDQNGGLNITGTSVGTFSNDSIYISASDIASFGDGDTLFENGEIITIVETITIISCNNVNSDLQVMWGCDGNYCQVSSTQASVQIASGLPNLDFIYTEVSDPTPCTGGTIRLDIVNNGSESFTNAGAAFDILGYIGFYRDGDDNTAYPDIWWTSPSHQLSNFLINGNPVTTTLLPYSASANVPGGWEVDLSQFFADPDGVGGLQDLDGDGQFDDLALGDTVTILFDLTMSCSGNCNINMGWANVMSRFDFQSHCKDTDYFHTERTNNVNIGYIISYANTSSNVGPSDVSDGDTITLRMCHNREFRGSFSCPTDSLRLVFNLPAGFILTGNNTYIPDNGNPPVSLAGSSAGGTATILGGGWEGCYEVEVVMNCALSPPASSTISYQLEYVCDNSCGCTYNFSCGDIEISHIHCNPVCPDGGFRTTSMDLQRTTFGWTDTTMTSKVTALTPGIRTNYGMPCDTFQLSANSVLEYGGVITGPTNSAHFQFAYDGYINDSILSYVNDGSGMFTIYDASTGTVYNCNAPTPSITWLNPTHTVDFDLSSLIGTCLPAGFLFESGDSVNFVGNWVVLVENDIPDAPTQLPNIVGMHYTVSGTTNYNCEAWGASIYLLQGRTNTWEGDITFDGGCDTERSYAYFRYAGATAEDDFPNEFRPYTFVDSFTVDLPAGYTYVIGSARASYPNYAIWNESINDPIITGNRLTFINAGTWRNFEKIYDVHHSGGNGMRIDFQLSTTCGSQTGDYTGTWHYTMNAYASESSCQYDETRSITQQIVSNIPSVSILSITDSANVYDDTTFTSVTVCNEDNSYNADFVWVSLESPSNSINIISVTDTTGGGSVSLPIINYGPGQYWVQVTNTLNSATCRSLMIEYEITSCAIDSLIYGAGWDCAGYPTDPTTYSCNIARDTAYFTPVDGEMQVSITAPSGTYDMCDSLTYEIEIASTQLASIKNVLVYFIGPIGGGVSPQPGSSELIYPHNGSAVSIPDPTPAFGNVYFYNLNTLDAYFAANGIPGVTFGDSSRVKIRFRVQTDCNYISGSNFYFAVRGEAPCGKVLLAPIQSSSIQIKSVNLPYVTNINLNTMSSQGCSQTENLQVEMIVSGFGTTSSDDSVFVNLPADITYAGNYIPSLNASTNAPVITAIGSGTRLAWSMDTALVAGDTIRFSLDISSNWNAACSNYPIEVQTVVSANLVCITDSSICNSFAQTGSAFTSYTITKPDLDPVLTFSEYVSASGNDTYEIHGQINNNGTVAVNAGTTTYVEFYCDSDGSGTFTAGDILMGTYSTTAAIPAAGSHSFTTFFAQPTGTCTNDIIAIVGPDQGQGQCTCDSTEFTQLTVLPVEWLNLKAYANGNQNAIEWEVEQKNVSKYSVEHMLEDKTWESIQDQDATQVNGIVSYQTAHANPKNLEYYRIKQISLDGTSTYSNVVEVQRNNAFEFKVYPNPAKSRVYIQVSEYVDYEIVGIYGSILKKGELKIGTTEINLSELSAGMYYLKIKQKSGETHIEKLNHIR